MHNVEGCGQTNEWAVIMIGLGLRANLESLDHLIDVSVLRVLIVEDGDDRNEDVEDDADVADKEDNHEGDAEVDALFWLGDVFEGEATKGGVEEGLEGEKGVWVVRVAAEAELGYEREEDELQDVEDEKQRHFFYNTLYYCNELS